MPIKDYGVLTAKVEERRREGTAKTPRYQVLLSTPDGTRFRAAINVDHHILRAAGPDDATVSVFGQRWGPEADTPDETFGFTPGNGVHDVHMNQGNSADFARDDGVGQDGGVLIHFEAEQRWVALFLAFQSQDWHTDPVTGHTIGGAPPAVSSATVDVDLTGGVVLGNDGTISLLDGAGLEVDGVACTRDQAHREGWTVRF